MLIVVIALCKWNTIPSLIANNKYVMLVKLIIKGLSMVVVNGSSNHFNYII